MLDAICEVMSVAIEGGQNEKLGEEDVRIGEQEASIQVQLRLSGLESHRAKDKKHILLSWNSGNQSDSSECSKELIQAVRRSDFPLCTLLPANRGVLEWDPKLPRDKLESHPFLDSLSKKADRWRSLALRLGLMYPRMDDEARPFRRIWKALKRHFPSFPEPVDVKELLLYFKTPDGKVPLYRLSDGQRALLLILGELAYRNPEDGVVLIDEPEQHLHPAWTQPLQLALRELFPSTQFLYTTHAPLWAHAIRQRHILGAAEALIKNA
jgi:hypothetical protein